MKQNKSSNETPEQIILIPNPREISINHTLPQRAYGLFDSETGTQVSDFIKGTDGQVEFKNLQPARHYDVGVVENAGDDKPQFAINWIPNMRDDTDSALNNSDNLPVQYPYIYVINYKDKNLNGVYNLTDENNQPVAEVISLTQTDDKPRFEYMHTFKMKDDKDK